MSETDHPHEMEPQAASGQNPEFLALSLEQTTGLTPHPHEEGSCYLRLDLPWDEFFYWMAEMGEVLTFATNGWGFTSRKRAFDGWHRVPGDTVWIESSTGSQLDTAMMAGVIAVEQNHGDSFSLSLHVIHRNGQGHFKLHLSHRSELSIFYDLLKRTAIEDPMPEPEPMSPAMMSEVDIPPVEELRANWCGSTRLMPTEVYAGGDQLARWVALSQLGEEYAEPMALGCLNHFFERLMTYQVPIHLDLYHPDHITSQPLKLERYRGCNCWWHLFGEKDQLHLRKVNGLRVWRANAKPGTGAADWLEIYHRPTRRLLAWMRPVDRAEHLASWHAALSGLPR